MYKKYHSWSDVWFSKQLKGAWNAIFRNITKKVFQNRPKNKYFSFKWDTLYIKNH